MKLVKKNKHDRTYFEKQIPKLQARIALFKTNYNNPEDDAKSEQLRQENECKQSILEVENGDLQVQVEDFRLKCDLTDQENCVLKD